MEAVRTDIDSVATYTICRLIQNGNTITPLKLQKMLYYAQAWHMVYFGEENTLFEDVPEAWVNGPVYRRIYEKYRHIGIYEQMTPSAIGESEEGISKLAELTSSAMGLTRDQNEYLESVISHYGSMSADRLVLLTHSEGPWNDARKNAAPFEYSNERISHKSMFDYYSSLRSKHEN